MLVVDSAAENTIVVAPGANAHLSVTSADIRAVIADSEWCCCSWRSRSRRPSPQRGRREPRGRSSSSTRHLRVPPHQLLALSELADVVVVNEAEAREWHWPIPHLVITRGARGASYLGPDERFDVPSPAVEAIDTTERAMCSPACSPRDAEGMRMRCGGRARQVPCRPSCRGRAIARLMPRRSRHGFQQKGSEPTAMTTTTGTPRPPDGDWLGTPYPALHAGGAVRSLHAGPSGGQGEATSRLRAPRPAHRRSALTIVQYFLNTESDVLSGYGDDAT